MELWTIFLRTVFIYFTVLIIMRFMGKREVGELSILDLIVSFMIADISSMAIGTKTKMVDILLPLLTLAALQIIMSFFSLKSKSLRRWVDGKPSIIIKNGKIQDNTMNKLRYNMDDLMMQLRQKDIFSVEDVEFAILEVDGQLSVFPKMEKQAIKREDLIGRAPLLAMPVPLIVDGKVQDEGLLQIKQNRFWLKKEIQKHGVKSFKDVYFASISSTGDLFIDKRKRP